MLERLNTIEQFADILQQEDKFFLLKHSLTCPISKAAYQEYQKFSEDHKEVPSYFLAVQEARPLSNEIAEKYQIKHESPQAILFVNKAAVWTCSHWKITSRTLSSALNEN